MQLLPPSTCAKEAAFLAGPCGVRFRAPAVQLAPSGWDEGAAQAEDTLSGIFLCWAASSCLSAVSQRLFTFPSSTSFISLVQLSVLGPDALHTYLWTLLPWRPLQSHPAHASYSTIPAAAVPGCRGAMDMLLSWHASLEGRTFLRAGQELCAFGFASVLAARQVRLV